MHIKYHQSLSAGGICKFTIITNKQEAVWQAYHSPASLGFPLSSHRRVDGYEILHLKQPLAL